MLRFNTLLVLPFLGLCACGGEDDSTKEESTPEGLPSYELLSETGLYSDPSTQTLATGVQAFQPSYPLWSDGAEKQRWIQLPPGTSIDTTDMDHWTFPVGTRFWKEFSQAGVRLETRLIERFGTGADDFFMGSFVWDEAHSDAHLVEAGQQNLLGTMHDAPEQQKCTLCHSGEPGRILGFSALELAGGAASAGGVTLARLAADGRLSTPPPAGAAYAVPGDAPTQAALGYLHANCGNCHNPSGLSWQITKMVLRLDVDETVPQETALWQSVVGRTVESPLSTPGTARVSPGMPEASTLLARMQSRGMTQMPPIASEVVDTAGVAAVTAWISSLTP